MKKSILTLSLVLVFTFAVFADDGNTPVGSKNCQENQSCLVTDSQPVSKNENMLLVFIKRIIAEIF